LIDAAFTRDDVIAMERAAARAWPPRRIERVAGWQVRLSGGGTRRANSVLPLDYDRSPLDDAIDHVEALYCTQKTRCYFQVSSCAGPAHLDAQLAARGYTHEEPCVLMARRLSAAAVPPSVEVTPEPTADWLSVYTELLDDVRRKAAPATLASVPAKRAFFLVRQDDRPVTCALAVIAPDGVAVVECVATLATQRRLGSAGVVMEALEAWSEAAGARTAALQVVAGNTAARALYERRGYRQVGTYHYRWKDVG
jgi:N-acetylglutamate synthase